MLAGPSQPPSLPRRTAAGAGQARPAAAVAAADGSEAARAPVPGTVLALLLPAAALLPVVGMRALGASSTATLVVTIASVASGLITAHLPSTLWARSCPGAQPAAGRAGSSAAAAAAAEWEPAALAHVLHPW